MTRQYTLLSAKTATDAGALYKPCEDRMGTDETAFIYVLLLSFAEHVKSIDAACAAKYKTFVAAVISKQFSCDANQALLYLAALRAAVATVLNAR